MKLLGDYYGPYVGERYGFADATLAEFGCPMPTNTLRLALLLLGMLVLLPSHAQTTSTKPVLSSSKGSGQAFPTRPVRILVPLTPGGNMDTITRALAQKLGDVFAQTI